MNKKLIPLIIASALTVSFSANAMQGKGPRVEPQEIATQLSLDPSTTESLVNLMESHRQSMKAQRAGKQDRSYETFKQMRAQREQYRTQIEALLGPAKFEEFERMMWEQRQQHRHGKGHRSGNKS